MKDQKKCSSKNPYSADVASFQAHFCQDALIALGREKRPFISTADVQCPFCPQNLELLEKVVMEGWDQETLCARIVPNRYPVASQDTPIKGFHDVVIDTEHHFLKPRDFTKVHWFILLSTMQQRFRELMQQEEIVWIQIFKNDGEDAGASISHSHWQMLALESIPISMEAKYRAYTHQSSNACYLCGLTQSLLGGMLLYEDAFWYVWVPPMPEFMGEVWLVPKQHYQHYGALSEEAIENLGVLMSGVLKAYQEIKPDVAYNICMMSGDVKGKWSYHFYVKIVMRIGKIAGFEIASGCHILSQSPNDYGTLLKKKLKGIYT